MKKIVLYVFHQDLKSGNTLINEHLSDPTMVVLSYCLAAEAAGFIERSNIKSYDFKSMRDILKNLSSYIFSPTIHQDLNDLKNYNVKDKSDSKKQEFSLNLPFTNFLHKMIESNIDLRWIKLAIKCGVHPKAKNEDEETAFQVMVLSKHSSLLMQIQGCIL
jgi:hypothetical protein